MLVNPVELHSSIKKNDVYLYDKEKPVINKNPKKDIATVKNTRSIKKRRKEISWMKCLRRRTPSTRTRYCTTEFNSLDVLKKKCEVKKNFK